MPNKEWELGTPGFTSDATITKTTYSTSNIQNVSSTPYASTLDEHTKHKVIGINCAIDISHEIDDKMIMEIVKQKVAEEIAAKIQNHITFTKKNTDAHPFGQQSYMTGSISIVPEGTKEGIIYKDVGLEFEGQSFTRDEMLQAVITAFPERFI